MEWVGEAHIQIGAHDAPLPAQVSPFLAGSVDGLATHAAVRGAELLEVDARDVRFSNPTRHVRFQFTAGSYGSAERLASGELLRAGIRAGAEALDPSCRAFGWMVSVEVQPA